MELKKEIVMAGTSACIRLTKENLKLYGLNPNDVIYVTIETEKDRINRERANSRMAGTGGGHVKTAQEKVRDKEIIAIGKKYGVKNATVEEGEE